MNFYNPANRTQRGGAVPKDAARYAILVNDTMPGPKLDVVVGQQVNITVLNRLSSDSVAIHWHGIRQVWTFCEALGCWGLGARCRRRMRGLGM